MTIEPHLAFPTYFNLKTPRHSVHSKFRGLEPLASWGLQLYCVYSGRVTCNRFSTKEVKFKTYIPFRNDKEVFYMEQGQTSDECFIFDVVFCFSTQHQTISDFCSKWAALIARHVVIGFGIQTDTTTVCKMQSSASQTCYITI